MTDTELPRDAVGREIPPDTKVLYTADGIEVCVDYFVYGLIIHVNESYHNIVSNKWRVHSGCNVFDADRLYLVKPDSWEKLEDDLNRCIEESDICAYYSKDKTCRNCAISNDRSGSCATKVLDDILYRIRELRGEDE